jgi:hypothetical protein
MNTRPQAPKAFPCQAPARQGRGEKCLGPLLSLAES